jgi:hypothetical protein
VYYTIKIIFEGRNISCVSDGDVLVFEGRGNVNDSINIWIVIMSLLRADWFVSFATSCMYYDRDFAFTSLSIMAKSIGSGEMAKDSRLMADVLRNTRLIVIHSENSLLKCRSPTKSMSARLRPTL